MTRKVTLRLMFNTNVYMKLGYNGKRQERAIDSVTSRAVDRYTLYCSFQIWLRDESCSQGVKTFGPNINSDGAISRAVVKLTNVITL